MSAQPNQTVVTCRASGFAGVFDCALRWAAIHIDRIPSHSSARALLGTGFHAGTAAFDAARVQGSPISADDAAEATVRAIEEGAGEVAWSGDDLSRREVESKALVLHTMYCAEVSPQFDFCAVELALTPMDVDCGNGVVIRLTGHMDRARVRRESGKKGIDDLKTGIRAISNGKAVVGKHRPQLGIYELLYEHTTGERCEAPAGIIAASTGAKPYFATGTATESCRDLLVGTDEHRGLFEFAADMFKTGRFHPNPQSFLCSERYCPNWNRCKYHD